MTSRLILLTATGLALAGLGGGAAPAAAACPPAPEPSTIMEIQGAGHVSPCLGDTVATRGIVTARAFNGFYLQDPSGDGDPATSDGVFVFSRDAVSVGDEIALTGPVSEFIPGGAGSGNLSVTQISRPAITLLSSGNALPAPTVIGRSGRIPPNRVVISEDEIDPPINLQDPADAAANRFNPRRDGIDFYESLEGMRVTVERPVAVSATRTFSGFSSEFVTLPNRGRLVAPRNALNTRGGIALQPDRDNRGDQNPERVQIQLDGTLFPGAVPALSVGARLGDVTGVVGYSFGNFEVNATELFDIEDSRLTAEVTKLKAKRRKLTLASYNVLNLSPLAGDDNQRATLARQIVENLRNPDIIALQEIQDNNGSTADGNPGPDGVVEADQTLQALADAVRDAGGPPYAFFDVAPIEGSGGGVPGGNIRNAFFYNPARVQLVGFQSLTSDVLAAAGVSVPLAFEGTRKPLLATFRFRGRELTVINNHLSSRFGSTPIFGAVQPFLQAGEDARGAQTLALNEYVRGLLDENRWARIAVLGDLNTFEFTDELAEILPGLGRNRILTNVIDTRRRRFGGWDDDDDDDRGHRHRRDDFYSFNFEGNSQALDHIFVSRALRRGVKFDYVHVNVDFPRVDNTVGSDHEPLLARFNFGGYRHDD